MLVIEVHCWTNVLFQWSAIFMIPSFVQLKVTDLKSNPILHIVVTVNCEFPEAMFCLKLIFTFSDHIS